MAMVRSEGNMSLKNPVTSPGIDPGTVRLVAQHLNHYATPRPRISLGCSNGKGEVDRIWDTYGGEERYTQCFLRHMKEEEHSKNIDVDGEIIL